MASKHLGFILPGKSGKITLMTGVFDTTTMDFGVPSLQVFIGTFSSAAPTTPFGGTVSGSVLTPQASTAATTAVIGLQQG